jgi:hypothetical protein
MVVVRGRLGRECWRVFGEADGMALALCLSMMDLKRSRVRGKSVVLVEERAFYQLEGFRRARVQDVK